MILIGDAEESGKQAIVALNEVGDIKNTAPSTVGVFAAPAYLDPTSNISAHRVATPLTP
jgi:hypothetical protein